MSDQNENQGGQPLPTRTLPPIQPVVPVEKLSREQAESELKRMQADLSHPLNDANDIRHELAVGRQMRLYERLEALGEAPAAPAEPPVEKPLIPLPTVEGAPVAFDVPELNRHVERLERFGFLRGEVQDVIHSVFRRGRAIAEGREEMPDREATEATLRAEWGDQFERKILAAQLFSAALSDETRRFLDFTGLGDDVSLVRRAAAAGERLLPLYKRKLEIEADPDFMSLENATRHKAVVQERLEIMRKLAGESA